MKHTLLIATLAPLSIVLHAMQKKDIEQTLSQALGIKYEKEATSYTGTSYFSWGSYTQNALDAIKKSEKEVEHVDATNKINRALDEKIYYIQNTRTVFENVQKKDHPQTSVDTLLNITRENRKHINECMLLIKGSEMHNLGINPEILKKLFRTLDRENRLYWHLTNFMTSEINSYYGQNEKLLAKTHTICSDHPGSHRVYPYKELSTILDGSFVKNDNDERAINNYKASFETVTEIAHEIECETQATTFTKDLCEKK